jgi:adenylate cyclase
LKKIIIALVLAWTMIFILHFDSFYFVEGILTDKLTTKARPVDSQIKILAIDSESIEKIGKFPWPRDTMADLIDKVATGGATAVWVDFLFTEQSPDPEEDKALAQVVVKHNNVYLPVRFRFEALQKPKRQLEQEYLKLPVVDIPKDRLGHTNILPDKDNVLRKALLGIPSLEEEIIPIIDVRLANLFLPEESKITWNQNFVWQKGKEIIPIDERLQVGFAYASSTVQSQYDLVPAWRVMQGEIDPTYFKDSLVFIGPYAPGLQDQFNTPTAKNQMYEVEIHANITQALIDNALYTQVSKARAIMIVVLVAVLAFALFERVKAKLGIIILVLLIIANSGIVYYFYNSQALLLPYFYTIVALILAYTAFLLNQHFEKRKG